MEKNAFGQKVYYVDYTWKEMEALDRARVTLVLPSGSTEQHGPHLAMASDAAQAEEFTLRAARQVKDVIVLPALWYSTCLDTSNYTGTISLAPSVFIDMVVGILMSLYRNGFRKIVIANVHGAAKTPLDVAVREFHAQMGTRDKAYSDDCRIHLQNVYAPVAEYLNTLAEGKDWGHACEMETSVDLYLHPERVNMKLAVEDYIPWDKGFEWYIGDMHAADKTGVHGAATKGSAEKGKKIVDAIVAALTDILKRF
jgi:creatinine amidohydrolase